MGTPRRRRGNRGGRGGVRRIGVADGGSGGGIGSLPRDLLIEVLGRVATCSFTDLFNAKLCCKDFLNAAQDEYILENISIDKFPVIQWFPPRQEVISFLNKCKERGNPEALFRQGMINFFSSTNIELGLEYLKKATEKGHIEATYVYGIILLSKGGQSSQQSLDLLKAVYKQRLYCRARVKDVLKTMWINNSIVGQHVKSVCTCQDQNNIATEKKAGGSWNYDEDDDASCDTCRWNREVVSFCKML